jgi:DNA-binding LacI/PurR family transcriptional regulator
MKEYPPRRSRVTASQVAQKVGLAQSTVSHILNGRGDGLGIRPETQLRVREAAAKLGYLPNRSARAMRSGRFGAAALVQSTNRVFMPPSLLLGLTEALHERQMRLVLAESADAEIGEAVYLPSVMHELSVDGLLINVLQDVPAALLDHIHASRVPAVWINTDQPADCVYPDDFEASLQATEHLLKLGHREIAFLQIVWQKPDEKEHYSSAARRNGYEKAMKCASLQPRFHNISPAPVWEIGQMTDNRIRDAHDFLSAPSRPTAIVAYEKDTALPVLLAALQMGLQVPRDLSLVMFHDGFDASIGITISTMIHNMHGVASTAVAMLDEKIQNPELSLSPRSVPPLWFEGQTCASPPP